MKIVNLTEAQKSEVKLHQEKISVELSALLKANQALNKLTQRQTTLEKEIATLESVGPDDKSAIQKLGEKRTELELVTRRISEIPVTSDTELEQKMKSLLREATVMIPKILLPTYEKYLAEVSALLRPFSIDDGWAKGVAQKTNAAISLAQAISRNYGLYGGAVSNAKEVLKRYEEILAGEFAWEFNPKLNK